MAKVSGGTMSTRNGLTKELASVASDIRTRNTSKYERIYGPVVSDLKKGDYMYSDNGNGKYEIQKVTSLNQDRNGQIAYEAEGYTYNPRALASNSPSQIKVSRKNDGYNEVGDRISNDRALNIDYIYRRKRK